MSFQVRAEQRENTLGLDGTVWILEDTANGAGVEVWPAHGFNCYRWFVTRNSRRVELLYADPNFFTENRPTRSGIPILFPFPNRIRDGRFTWDGKRYELPRNDPGGKNALHGFACRRPWRVIDSSADGKSAWITAEFHGWRDALECRSLWPADYRLRLTYRLGTDSLRLEALVDNPDLRPLPFGLGYHPYFRVSGVANAKPQAADEMLVQAPAQSYWVLQDNLPNGERMTVDHSRDLNSTRRFGDVTVDDVLTDLDLTTGKDGLCHRGRAGAISLQTSPSFRELVVFTPPHRQAICLEPYTCTTDAINLQQRGVDAGWQVLAPGETWTGVVQMVVS